MRIVFDSGPLINLANNCLLDVLRFVPAEMYIPPAVYREVYGYPSTKKMYAWSAVLINEVIGKKVLLRTLSARERSLVEHLDHLMNSLFYSSRGPIRIVHPGEIEAVVLASEMDKVVAIDERTMRLIVEDVDALKKRLSSKIHAWVKVDKKKLEEVQDFLGDLLVVRSVDLVAYAYEKGYFSSFKDSKTALRASLYALKYGGCAVSEEEIERFLRRV